MDSIVARPLGIGRNVVERDRIELLDFQTEVQFEKFGRALEQFELTGSHLAQHHDVNLRVLLVDRPLVIREILVERLPEFVVLAQPVARFRLRHGRKQRRDAVHQAVAFSMDVKLARRTGRFVNFEDC
jgi:hypothetical protein